jgi:hypothetical protein
MKLWLLPLFFLASHAVSQGASTQDATCPNTTLGETQEDCPWAEISRTSPFDLKKEDPTLATQITTDGERHQLKNLWGQSINYDELAHGIILDPILLKSLSQLFKTPWISDRVTHAGLEHTYGYLFSTLKTAFGYKRARWVHGDIERGFSMTVGTFGPHASETSGGTLFSNVTYFFGEIAFRNDPIPLATLKRFADMTPNAFAEGVKNFNYSSLKTVRLEETIANENNQTASRPVVLRTDLVLFPNKPTDVTPNSNQYLLIYSVVTEGSAKLITGFPVSPSFVDQTLNPSNLGEHKPITVRYNAFIEGLSGETLQGTRRIVQ